MFSHPLGQDLVVGPGIIVTLALERADSRLSVSRRLRILARED